MIKKLFGPAWLTARLTGLLPKRIFRIGAKTPWYRQSWMMDIPWIAAVLAAPLAIFLAWRGADMLWSRMGSQSKSR